MKFGGLDILGELREGWVALGFVDEDKTDGAGEVVISEF